MKYYFPQVRCWFINHGIDLGFLVIIRLYSEKHKKIFRYFLLYLIKCIIVYSKKYFSYYVIMPVSWMFPEEQIVISNNWV